MEVERKHLEADLWMLADDDGNTESGEARACGIGGADAEPGVMVSIDAGGGSAANRGR